MSGRCEVKAARSPIEAQSQRRKREREKINGQRIAQVVQRNRNENPQTQVWIRKRKRVAGRESGVLSGEKAGAKTRV